MAALSAMGQQGGWPLTMFLRPDGKPFWGGTYFPPKARHNMPGFVDVLNAVNNLWQGNKEKLTIMPRLYSTIWKPSWLLKAKRAPMK